MVHIIAVYKATNKFRIYSNGVLFFINTLSETGIRIGLNPKRVFVYSLKVNPLNIKNKPNHIIN